MDISCKLYDFKAEDIFNRNDDDSTSDEEHATRSFSIKLFGIDKKGDTYCIWINDFKPFFYIKLPSTTKWKQQQTIKNFVDFLELKAGDSVSYNVVQKKKLYGFDGNKLYPFMKVKCCSMMSFYKIRKLWYDVYNKEKKLKKLGFKFDGSYLTLYESDIPPLLKFFHVTNISPSGWVNVKKCNKHVSTTSCKYEYEASYKDVSFLNDDSNVPYKICSMDIEADSSHGDFPLPIKDYTKLASNIMDIYEQSEFNEESTKTLLIRAILTAFDFDTLNKIERIYTLKTKTKYQIESIIQTILQFTVSQEFIENLNKDLKEEKQNKQKFIYNYCDENVEEPNEFIKKTDTTNIIDVLLDDKYNKNNKFLILNSIFNKFLPKVKGDIVTFIGSTFIRYGETKPYLNHIIVLNGCKSLDELPNSVVECYDTEREVLLAWTNLIKRECPQFVIGYNIFGFDYPFMVDRCMENNCEDEFMQISYDNTEKSILKESSIVLASGQHDLKYIEMDGIVQIDLYNHFRRDFNLDSYKLDYVSGYFMCGSIHKVTHREKENRTILETQNTVGLELHSYIHIEEIAHSTDYYKNGDKFKVVYLDKKNNLFHIEGIENPDQSKSLKWCLAKDDVGPKDIFRLARGNDSDRAVVAKYCIQDCNLVQELLKKIDIMTGFIEMSKICSVPISFLVLRGQGIKLTSFISKKCMEKNTLMPTIEKATDNEGYEGAIVLEPKKSLYMEDPVACVDYSSLYPSSMISENLCHSSKVSTKEFDLNGNLIAETGEKDKKDTFKYDNLPGYKYVDVTYDTFKYVKKSPKAAAIKVKQGYKICRFAQYPDGKKAVMPSVLEELLASRKATKKQAAKETDPFMKNILDKRQLSIKLTANSLYGQTGAKTSTFYEKDVAASTTATGRKLLLYGKRIIEDVYGDTICESKKYGKVRSKAQYIYGDTDSVFFCFYFQELDGTPIKNKKALELTIEIAQEAGELATAFLKNPHDLEYEKTFWPLALFGKKKYCGILYEHNPDKGKRKSMGIVLKRRDNAPIVKDVYGGIIDSLMKDKSIPKSIDFLESMLHKIAQGDVSIDKLIITKSLRGNYKNPLQIAHKVLADRMGDRDPGNKPGAGDRIPFAYFVNKDKKALQGDKIENPSFIQENKLSIDYEHYITNQIMKPVMQIYALVIKDIPQFKKKKFKMNRFIKEMDQHKKTIEDPEKLEKKLEQIIHRELKELLFLKYIKMCNKEKTLASYFN